MPWESVIVASKTLSVDIFWLFSVWFFNLAKLLAHDFLRNLFDITLRVRDYLAGTTCRGTTCRGTTCRGTTCRGTATSETRR